MGEEDIRLTQLATGPHDSPRFTRDQLTAYFERIELPSHWRKQALEQDDAAPQQGQRDVSVLPLLKAIMQYHIHAIPFENLILHYSNDKSVTLDPQALFEKFVVQGFAHGRGGRCMENNTFFAVILRSLGFVVRTCAGRVSRSMSPYSGVRMNQAQTYDGLNHMVLLVHLSSEWYVVDVGMGAMGPTLPYPLRDGHSEVAVAPRKLRIQWRSISETAAQSEEQAPKLWCFDVCRQPTGEENKDDEWVPTYCFTETEMLPQDYEVMSWYTSTSPRMFFTKLMMATRLIMDEEGKDLIGDITLVNDAIRQTIGGKREIVAEFKTENERRRGLEKFLGIKLTDEQASSLRGPLRLAEY